MKEMTRVAVDGPGGAGKSTAAKNVAKELGIDYVDTGAMYRAVACKMKEKGIPAEGGDILDGMLAETEIDFAGGDVLLDGRVVSGLIRTPEMSKLASDCSAIFAVREKLVALQKEMGRRKSIVMDGRDIGTNVLPDAEFKFFLTAKVEERAKRRYSELLAKGQEAPFEEVLRDMAQRDRNDSTRELNPLKKADDAIEVDTTDMTIEEVSEYLISVIKGGGDGNSKTV
ncbi:MAG: (d)CMP kinase [Clostridiales bacterium]|nr:(d)CMP kinase [Clostridiales bacterium]